MQYFHDRTIIKCFVLLVSCYFTCGYAVVQECDARPNVLWIIADDLSPDLGCYGARAVETPNLDRLAREGVRFEHAFVTAPACSPSRTALITGMYQTTLGGHQHRTRSKPQLPEGARLITECFREAGYYVCNGNSNLSGGGKTDYNLSLGGGAYDGRDWRQRQDGQPFFAQVQIYQPHRPFRNENDPRRARRVQLPPYLPDHPIARQDWANYLAEVESVDEQVGRILDRLEADGLADSTMVVFFGDHGRPQVRCKQWLYDGGIHIPLIIRWPDRLEPRGIDDRLISLIDLAPTCLAAANISIPDAMQGEDFLAEGYAGRDVIFAARDRSGDAFERIRCIRDERFKYIRNFTPDMPYGQWSSYLAVYYPVYTLLSVMAERGELGGGHAWFGLDNKPEEELYDLANDPFELNNLASDPDYRDRLEQMRGRLEIWVLETGDRGVEIEGDEAFNQRIRAEKLRWYHNTLRRRGLDQDASPEEYLRWWAQQMDLR